MNKKLLITSLLVGAFSWCFCSLANAQISINVNQSPADLAQELVGQGITMLNPVMNGSCPIEGNTSAAGKFNFNGNPSDIGIDSGILLTTGKALDVANPASFFASTVFAGGGPGDPDLTAISGNTTNDACVLEFDFVPTGDTIKFDYVFGSDEYPTFQCSSFNDVFAFFISGPGLPAGLNNIALVPGTTIPVAINSINDAANPTTPCTSMGPGSPFSQYYVNNGGGQHIAYYGFSTVLTAISHVNACDTYHLKLAIADAGDHSYDSGVFLRSGSLSSTGASISSATTQGANQPGVTHCVRGCKPGKFTFTTPTPSSQGVTVHYAIGGTAVNGVDYQTIADSILIPPGATSVDLDIFGNRLANPVGPRTVTLYVLSAQAGCGPQIGGNSVIDSATLTIYDSLFVDITTPPSHSCPGDTLTITATLDPTLTYTWAPADAIPDPNGLTIHPSPTVTTTYSITATMPGTDPNTCFQTETFTAVVDTPPTLIMPAFDTTVCLTDSIDLDLTLLPSNVSYDVHWFPADFLRDDFSQHNRFFAPPGNYHYRVIAQSLASQCKDTAAMTIRVAPPAAITAIHPTDTTIHYGDQIQLRAEGNIQYWTWTPTSSLDDPTLPNPKAAPKQTTTYTVIGLTQYGCRDTAEVTVNVEYNPIYQLPNAFSPNGDGLNDYFNLANIQYERVIMFRIFDRFGQVVYNGNNPEKGWDGTHNGKALPMDTYFYVIKLALPIGDDVTLKGSLTLLR